MRPAWRRTTVHARQEGHGWLELAVVAVLISSLAAVLLWKLLDLQAMAERTAMELTIANMRTGLRFRVAALIAEGRANEIAGLVGTNPVDFLEQPPAGYLGEFGADTGQRNLARGNWFFKLREQELIYVVNNEDGSMPRGGRGAFVRLRVAARQLNSRDPGVSIQVMNPDGPRRN